MQSARDATHQYCLRNNMTINASKIKLIICCREKTRNMSTFVVNCIESGLVDIFCYPGIIFKNNHTFQSSTTNNVKNSQKARFKLEVLCSKTDFKLETLKLEIKQKFDTLIQPILLYGSQIWGHETLNKMKSSIVHFYSESSGGRGKTSQKQ